MNANQALRGSKALGAVGLSLTLALTAGGRVQAAPVDLELTLTSTLTNVDDAEGRWQYDGGEVRLGGNLVGYYARKKRVSFGGTSPLNTAAVEITLFAIGDDPPQNLTLHGSHSFNNGEEIGSISAASSDFGFLVGVTFSVSGDVLTLDLP